MGLCLARNCPSLPGIKTVMKFIPFISGLLLLFILAVTTATADVEVILPSGNYTISDPNQIAAIMNGMHMTGFLMGLVVVLAVFLSIQ